MDIEPGAFDTYEQAYADFSWDIPKSFNIPAHVCQRWAERPDGKQRVALFYEYVDGGQETYTFWQVQREVNRVSNVLRDVGVSDGTRVGIILGKRPETLFANLATLQAGGISVPLSVLYGTEGLTYRLQHSKTEVAIVDQERAEMLAELRPKLEHLETVLTIDCPRETGDCAWREAVSGADTTFDAVESGAEDSAYILYTSGTTGKPKGVHHAHRCLAGYFPGWQLINDFPEEGAVYYTPAGWSWVGGLFATVWCAWSYGHPVVGYDGQFDPEVTYSLLERYGVTHPFLTATMIRMMKDADLGAYDLDLEVVWSGGEKVSQDVAEFVADEWGAPVNEIYGLTECNFLLATNQRLIEPNQDAAGKPVPGHVVDVIDGDTGERMADGEIGHIAVQKPDPSMLLEYWNDPERTDELFVGDWMKTGDAGYRDEDGYLYYEGRADSIIITSGYRVSPITIEETLREHAAVSDAVVVGADDEDRGTVIKAFVKPTDSASAGDELTERIQTFVREREAEYAYPRIVEYREEFPTTASGKVQRYKLI